MRIALIITDLTPPRFGGISKVATEVSYQAGAKGHEVHVYCLPRAAAHAEKFPGIHLHSVQPFLQLYHEYPVVSFSMAAMKRVLSDHGKQPFDVCHAMNLNNFAMPFFYRQRLKRSLPYVATGFETLQMDLSAKWQEFLQRHSWHVLAQVVLEGALIPVQRCYLKWADQVTTEDEGSYQAMLKIGVASDRLRKIPSGVDVPAIEKAMESYRKTDKEAYPQLLCPGRVDPRKGTQYLVQAMPAVLRDYPQAQLTIAGGGRGDYHNKIQTLIDELGLGQCVKITGQVESMYPYYQSCDLVTIPSLSEGIPITLQEAVMFGKGVVCSQLTGAYAFAKDIPSITWSHPADPKGLAKAIIENLNKVGNEQVKAAQSFMRQYDWSRVTDGYLDAYKEAILVFAGHDKGKRDLSSPRHE